MPSPMVKRLRAIVPIPVTLNLLQSESIGDLIKCPQPKGCTLMFSLSELKAGHVAGDRFSFSSETWVEAAARGKREKSIARRRRYREGASGVQKKRRKAGEPFSQDHENG